MSISPQNKQIYLDNAAATPVDPRVIQEVVRGSKLTGNPSSYNDAGRIAAQELAKGRLAVARFLGAQVDEIIFTASGSEANALALRGVAGAYGGQGRVLLTAATEHLSVLQNTRVLEKEGMTTAFIPVDQYGKIKPADIIKAISSKTLIISLMYANNEIGTIHPIAAIGKIITKWRKENNSLFPLFHVDACQAAGYLPLNVNQLGVDLLSFNGSKIYGPRGTGVLYVRRGIKINPLVVGGGQEYGRRAGTENLPGVMGLAKAITCISKNDGLKVAQLRDYFFKKVQAILPDAGVNGPQGSDRLANNINISFPNLESEYILLELDKVGIRAGSGSACTARSVEPSHVLKATGTPEQYLHGAIRLSLGKTTKKSDLDYTLKVLPVIVRRLNRRFKRSFHNPLSR